MGSILAIDKGGNNYSNSWLAQRNGYSYVQGVEFPRPVCASGPPLTQSPDVSKAPSPYNLGQLHQNGRWPILELSLRRSFPRVAPGDLAQE